MVCECLINRAVQQIKIILKSNHWMQKNEIENDDSIELKFIEYES